MYFIHHLANILFSHHDHKKSKDINAICVKYCEPGRHQLISSTRSLNPNPKLTHDERIQGCQLGMDSHADVSCVGKHARILEVIEGQSCTVRPFNDSYKPMENVKTVNAAFALDSDRGGTYIVHLNQALDFSSSMEHSILCTNQARHNNVVVDDVPKIVDWNEVSTHSVYFPNEDVRFPLFMNGPVSFLNVRYPSDWEMEHCTHLDLTNGTSLWNPKFFEEEDRISGLRNMSSDPVISSMMMEDVLQDLMELHTISALVLTLTLLQNTFLIYGVLD